MKLLVQIVLENFRGRFIFSKFILSPPTTHEDYEKYLFSCIENYDLIIPTSEQEIKKIGKCKISNLNDSFLILPKHITDIFFNKYSTANHLKSLDIASPSTKFLSDITNEELPIYIKPIYGAGGKGNRLLKNKYDLLSVNDFKRKEWVAQEFLEGEDNEYTCVIFKNDNTTEIIQLKRKLFGDRTGIAELVNNPSIEKLLMELSKKLNFIGSINIQLKLTNHGPKIFEINPRLSSTVMMRDLMGFKDCVWWVKSFFGLPIKKIELAKPGTKVFRMSREKII